MNSAPRVQAGDRFAGVFAARSEGGTLSCPRTWTAGGIDTLEVLLPPGAASYPALTPRLGAAFWYERVIHDASACARGASAAGAPGPAR